MAFDQSTRNRLARFVGDARSLLSEEFTRQLQNEYGMDPDSGTVSGLDKLTALDDSRRETARILRETMEYYLAGKTDDKKNRQDVLQRIVREQAFTVLNRLSALRMAESRGILIESIAHGYQSKGFQLYARLAGTGLGETGYAYRTYLFSLFDEFAVDLAVLFDRFSPQGRLFPRETALLKLMEQIDDPEIEHLWAEDETIGWIYQYFNTREERQQMRAASQAPRNSRELAVRNQFFTPRYVVEFLTDNTLGRIWYEMTRGKTALKDSCQYLVRRPTEIFLNEGAEAPTQEVEDENLSQEELLKQPVYIPHRPLKDPREIKMLDPACGSMHFGLYAFDLFEQIYAEAWDLEETLGKDALWRLADLDSLHDTYLNKELFLRDVPRLIIERNIHGVDIDPRAVQIAGLSLWLRAQNSWQAHGVKPQDRPQIRRSNIVCAEPMPGDKEMLEEFLQSLKGDRLETLMRKAMNIPTSQKVRATKAMADALANLVRTIWQEMELAGEAGSLLKIEETLRDAIIQARKKSEEKAPLFQTLEYGTNGLAEGENGKEDFWKQAEALTLLALQDYADQAANGQSYRRHLFAGDATQGFSFIDLCRKRYDIVLMNPPFGQSSVVSRSYLDSAFSDHNDLASRFISRSLLILINAGLIGAITTKTLISTSSAAKWRLNSLARNNKLRLLLDLGEGVLDNAMVETASYTIEHSHTRRSALFLNLSDFGVQSKAECLVNSLNNLNTHNEYSFWVDPEVFSKIPGNPFSYWASPKIRSSFTTIPVVEGFSANVRKGLTTSDDFRFVRCWWEVDPRETNFGPTYQNKKWVNFNKGGGYSPFFSDIHLVVNWNKNAKELRSFSKSYLRNEATYFKAGLSFPIKNRFRFSVKPLPAGSIYGHVGSSIFLNEEAQVYKAMAVFHSKAFSFLIKIISGWNYEIGSVQNTPLPVGDTVYDRDLSLLAKTLLQRKRERDRGNEISHLFSSPIRFMPVEFENSESASDDDETLLDRIDELSYKLYSFGDQDIPQIESYLKNVINTSAESNSLEDEEEENLNTNSSSDLLSWLFGCLFARWDIRYSTGEKKIPLLSDPFSPLPTCSSGMLQDNQGFPARPEELPTDYPIRVTWNGIMVDDEGHPEDIEERAHHVLRVILKDDTESVEAKLCQALTVQSLREYFQKPTSFFADHLSRYSKSRRQAPIYWPLSTPSNSYTLWLYYHRLNDQTLYTCVNDFIDRKLKQISDDAKNLRQKKSRDSSEEKELERLIDLEHELRDFREELLRVAKFWKPNLNDGVQITAAPLWRLFQHRPWQKKLKETWKKLEDGEYDWAHLAYSIWPERVREKCKTDKSLAIAHDLENLYVEPKVPLKKERKSAKKQPDIFEDV